MQLTPEACRAGRAILKWSMRDLATNSGVAWTTINRIEGGGETRPATVERIKAAFEAEGVELVLGDDRSGAVLVLARRRPSPGSNGHG